MQGTRSPTIWFKQGNPKNKCTRVLLRKQEVEAMAGVEGSGLRVQGEGVGNKGFWVLGFGHVGRAGIRMQSNSNS